MYAEELLGRYAAGERDFKGVKLSVSEELEGVCLQEIDFSYCRIDCASFIRTNLRGARLKNMTLWQADFTGANLSGADLSGADLSETCFEKANLNQTILRDAIGSDTNFMRTIFLDTIMPDGSSKTS